MVKAPGYSVQRIWDGYWRVNIPARFNATGKRSRPTFKTRRAAEHYAKDLRESERSYEASSKRLRPSEIEDAQLACQQLEGLGVNLPVI